METIRTVTCWGDSLTESMRMADTDRYPKVLNDYLGDGYVVNNCGDGGETSLAIMARQGAVPVFTESEITFAAGETRAYLGNGTTQGLVNADGKRILFTAGLGRELSINELTIDGNSYTLALDNFDWPTRSCDVYLSRKKASTAVTIAAGTPVTLACASVAKTNHCDVYLMGANGGFDDHIPTLIEQFHTLAAYRGNDNFLIVCPYWRTDCTAPLKEAFGDKAIDFVEFVKSADLAQLGVTATEEDATQLQNGYLPACLSLTGVPIVKDVHMNKYGYYLLATVVFQTGKALGYWD